MLNIVESNDNNYIKMNNINLSLKEELYLLKLDNNDIGYGIINNDAITNKVYIHIFDEYQSNGYGTYLFKKLLKILNEKLEFSIDYSNYKALRIIYNCNGQELARKDNLIYLVVPPLQK